MYSLINYLRNDTDREKTFQDLPKRSLLKIVNQL